MKKIRKIRKHRLKYWVKYHVPVDARLTQLYMRLTTVYLIPLIRLPNYLKRLLFICIKKILPSSRQRSSTSQIVYNNIEIASCVKSSSKNHSKT